MDQQSKDDQNEASIFARITVNGKRAEMSLQRSVDPSEWDVKSGRMKGNSERAKILNSYINLKKAEIEKCYNIMLSKGGRITSEAIKNELTGKGEKNKTLLELLKYHNDQMKKVIGIDIVEETWERYETCYKKLVNFIKKEYNKSDIDLENLNYKFITSFDYYLKNEYEMEHNSSMKYIKILKKVMGIAVRNEWLNVDPFAKFKCNLTKTNREYLFQEELEKIISVSFENPRLERVKDIFLFQCFTGYAYIDVKKFSRLDYSSGIDGKKWIITQRTKTHNQSNVPLLSPAVAIIEKYWIDKGCIASGNLLPVNSNQKMNDYLKEIAVLAGIKKQLTTHMARHTFATTVTLSNDVPIETVSKMLGHTSIKTTQIYARVLDKKVGEDMEKLEEKLFSKVPDGLKKVS